MGTAVYNRASRVIRERITDKLNGYRLTPYSEPCLCGAARAGSWTAGVHHGFHRCARVITIITDKTGRQHA